ncbi:MAG: hypothetical protein M3159_05160 [Actinomycetota bacterium]|nr:hypothetical protein [Actinomycetota bacterium]
MAHPSDERRHPPGPGPHWEESWYFDFALPDGSFGGYLRLGLRAAENKAWWWTCLAGDRRPLVSVRDHDVDPPVGRSLEVRASGLWGEITTETPLQHWSVGLEAFGVALDDPAEAWREERGDRIAVGFDLEWESPNGVTEPMTARREGYAQPCSVQGEVLLGDERLLIDANGWRTHEWGDHDWLTADERARIAGHLDDGAPVTSENEELRITTARRAPVLVTTADGRATRLDRSLCRFETASGRQGAGWCESAAAPA